MSTEAMKLALEALEADSISVEKYHAALTALREALAQPQKEPVAWMHEWEDGEKIPMLKGRDDRNQDKPKTVRPLVYGDTSPQPAQPQQEPVAKIKRVDEYGPMLDWYTHWTDFPVGTKLYTTPSQRKPLTDEEIEKVWRSVQANDFHDCVKPFARAVEAAHGIKENS